MFFLVCMYPQSLKSGESAGSLSNLPLVVSEDVPIDSATLEALSFDLKNVLYVPRKFSYPPSLNESTPNATYIALYAQIWH